MYGSLKSCSPSESELLVSLDASEGYIYHNSTGEANAPDISSRTPDYGILKIVIRCFLFLIYCCRKRGKSKLLYNIWNCYIIGAAGVAHICSNDLQNESTKAQNRCLSRFF